MSLTVEELKKELDLAKEELESLRQYKEETVWRITNDDFVIQIRKAIDPNFDEEKFEYDGELTDEEKAMIELAKRKFSIEDWTEWVDTWIDCWKNDFYPSEDRE